MRVMIKFCQSWRTVGQTPGTPEEIQGYYGEIVDKFGISWRIVRQ